MAVTREELNIKVSVSFKDGKKVITDITGEFKGLERQLKMTSKATDKAGKSFSKTSADVITLNQAIELSQKAFRVLAAAVNFTVANFARFEKGLIGVVKTANLSALQTKKFSDEILTLSETIPATTSELFGIAKAAGQLGVAAKELPNFTETIVRLGSAADISGDQAALATSRILGLTKLPVDKVDEFSSGIVELGNNLRANEAEILRTTTVIAQGIGVFGASAASVTALGGVARDLGIRFELAGSAITRTFIEISKGISEGGESLKTLSLLTGIAGKDLEKAFGDDAVGVFRKLLKGLSEIEATKVPAVLKAIKLEGVEINRVLPTLANNLDRVDLSFDLMTKGMKENTALAKESDAAFAILGAKIIIMGSVFTNLGTRIGKALAPVIVIVVEKITEMAKSLSRMVDQLDPATKSFNEFGEAISGIDYKSVATDIAAIAFSIAAVVIALQGTAISAGLAVATKALGLFAAKALLVISLSGGIGPALVAAGAAFLTFAKGLLVSAGGAALLVAKLAAISLVVTLIVKNISQLDKLFTLFFDQGVILVTKLTSAIAGFFGGMFDGAKEAEIALDKIIKAGEEDIELRLQDIDTGPIDFVFKKIAELTTEITKGDFKPRFGPFPLKSMKELGKETKKTSKEMQKLLDFLEGLDKSEGLKAQLDTLKSIEQENRRIETAILNVGATQEQVINNNLKLQIAVLEQKKEEFKANLDIVKALEKQIELKKLLAGKLIIELDPTPLEKVLKTLSVDSVFGSAAGFGKGLTQILGVFNAATGRFFEVAGRFTLKAFKSIGDFIQPAFESVVDFVAPAFEAVGEVISDAFKASVEFLEETLGPLFEGFGEFFADIFKDTAPDPGEATKDIQEAVGGTEAAGAAGGAAAGGAVGGFAAADKIADAIQGLIDFFPNFINKIANIFSSLTDLPQKLFEAFGNLISSMGKFISKFIPELLRSIPKSLKQLFITLPNVITSAFFTLLESLPDIIDEVISGIVDALPEMVSNMVAIIPKLVSVFISFLIRKLPKISLALTKALAIDLPKGIIKGLLEGLKEAFKAISGIFTGKFDIEPLKEKVEDFVRSISGVGSQLFEVQSLKAAETAEDNAKKIREAGEDAGRDIANAWQRIRDWFTDKFGPIISDAWKGFVDNVVTASKGFGDNLSRAWKGFVDNVGIAARGFGDNVSIAWKGFADNVGVAARGFGDNVSVAAKGLGDNISVAAKGLGDNIAVASKGLGDNIAVAGKGFGDNIANAWKDMVSGIQNAFRGLGDLIDFGGLTQKLKDIFSNFDPGSLIGKLFRDQGGSQGKVEGFLGIDIPIVNFAGGGLVPRGTKLPGTPVVSGDSELNDNILALVSPGEVILSRTQIKELEEIIGELPRFGLIKKPKFIQDAQDAAAGVAGAVGLPDLSDFEPGEFLEKGLEFFKDRIFEETMKAAEKLVLKEFAHGGFVSERGMVDPGEFVINKPSVGKIGTEFLDQLNRGRMPMGQGETSVSVVVNITSNQKIDEDFMRNRMIPVFKKELKRASLDGEFVMSQRGIRQ